MKTTEAETQSLPGKGEMVLAKNKYYSMDDFKTKRNNNALIVGVAGAGKTRGVVTPNLLQATGSYIISDPKGTLYKDYAFYLTGKGYKIINIDFVYPDRSDCYNPMCYCRNEQDYLRLAHLLTYTKSTMASNTKDPFWEQSTELLMSALIGYLVQYRPAHEQSIESITKLVDALEVNENNPDEKSPLDRIFMEVERRDPKSFCLKQYRKFRVAAGRTLKSVQISTNTKLNAMDSPAVHKMMKGNSIDFRKIGQEKTAVFVRVSDRDRSMDDFASIFFTQAMQELCLCADEDCENYRLPVPVRFILDDFATNVVIDDFPRMIASIRSRGISTMLCVQDESQLMAAYGQQGETIINNCDNYLYLGGNDDRTIEHISRRADVPRHRLLRMEIGKGWLMRRGEEPELVQGFELEPFEKNIFGNRKLAKQAERGA